MDLNYEAVVKCRHKSPEGDCDATCTFRRPFGVINSTVFPRAAVEHFEANGWYIAEWSLGVQAFCPVHNPKK